MYSSSDQISHLTMHAGFCHRPDLLAAETEKNTEFALALAHTLPNVSVAEAVVTALGGGVPPYDSHCIYN